MYEIKNKKIIEGFTNRKISRLVRRATIISKIISTPLANSSKLTNNIVKMLQRQAKVRSSLGSEDGKKVITAKMQMQVNFSIFQLIRIKNNIIDLCLQVLYYANEIKKQAPKIISDELRKSNKKASLNLVVAAKIKAAAVKKATRDLKYAKIRAKKIPRNKSKVKKNREKKEKILLNHTNLSRGSRRVVVDEVEYDYYPLRIALLCVAIYLLFTYIYFKL